ncbi:MAG: rhamnogalacturonan acetylesterase [Rikenellaceae bacterium]|nr:rhamnogalacturonan acetylesterase [Rikenellaceae bacterium]
MRIKSLLMTLIGLVIFSVASAEETQKPRIFIAGDSTAQTYDPEKTPMRGWGQYLAEFLTDGIEVDNRAIGGRSTASFIRENRWEKLVEDLRPGDWVLIQFGHNDTSKNPERHAEPDEYKNNLINFTKEAREKGANPVILTSIVIRTFNDEGELVSEREHFNEYVQIARDAAAEAEVPMIDVNKLTHALVQELGDEKTKELYFWIKGGDHPRINEDTKDDTHLQEKGARCYAQIIANEIKENIDGLKDYVK